MSELLKIKIYIFIAGLFFITNSVCSQVNKTDSLLKLITINTPDTAKIRIYLKISSIFCWKKNKLDSAIILSEKAIALAEKSNDKLKIAEAYKYIGIANEQKNNQTKALGHYLKSFSIYEKHGNNSEVANICAYVGEIYTNQNNFPLALQYLFLGLGKSELTNKYSETGRISSLLGNIYFAQEDYNKALTYYNKALQANIAGNYKVGISATLGSLGNVYKQMKNFPEALKSYKSALEISKEIGNKFFMANWIGNIGNLYREQAEYALALDYYLECYNIFKGLNYESGISAVLGNIGLLYSKIEKYKEAEEKLIEALSISVRLNLVSYQRDQRQYLSEVYELNGKPDKALENYKIYVLLNDSFKNDVTKKSMIEKDMRYEFDKKEALTKLEHEKQQAISLAEIEKNKIIIKNNKQAFQLFEQENKLNEMALVQKEALLKQQKAETEIQQNTINLLNKENEIKKAELAQQQAEIKAKRNQQYALFGGLFLVVVFAGFMYNRFKVTKKQKVIIEQKERETHAQKEIIEEKHKEITDSINYAERIQRSFLATREMLDENLRDYFVFFKPKDVVSGDFYWAAQLQNNSFAFTVADSTGHGVPGAIMSILNISSLEKSIETQTEPHNILFETRKIIINRLKKDGSPEGGKDGMDCSLLVLNHDKTQLSFASAHNPVFILRNDDNVVTSSADEGSVSRSNTMELIEFKGDKIPVGKHERENDPFTLHTITLQKGDVIYALTDGFPDQFGGDKGKKFMIKNLKELLLQIAHLPMPEQEQKLAEEFDKWKGSNEQVDDVCVIGVRV